MDTTMKPKLMPFMLNMVEAAIDRSSKHDFTIRIAEYYSTVFEQTYRELSQADKD
jgi:hypothetical protein